MFRATRNTEFYDLLGVQPTAADKDIRSAFRKRARDSHPDRNQDDPNAKKRFQELNEAYSIIGDENLRKIYDRLGPDAARQAQQQQDSGRSTSQFTSKQNPFNDVFEFGAFPFGRAQSARGFFTDPSEFGFSFNGDGFVFNFNQNRRNKVPPINKNINVTIESLFNDEPQVVTIPVKNENGDTIERSFRFKFRSFDEVGIPGGPPRVVRMRERGNASSQPGEPNGDIVFTFRLIPHKHLRPISSHDLVYNMEITLFESLFGFERQVDFFDDGNITCFQLPEGSVVKDGDKFKLVNKGLPPHGSLIVQFKVVYPDAILRDHHFLKAKEVFSKLSFGAEDNLDEREFENSSFCFTNENKL